MKYIDSFQQNLPSLATGLIVTYSATLDNNFRGSCASKPMSRKCASARTFYTTPRLWRRLLGFEVFTAEMVGSSLCKSKISVNDGGNSYSKNVPPCSYLGFGAGVGLGVV
jgi:hypothetical protein